MNKIAVLGAHGMIGFTLVRFLKKHGHAVIGLGREEFNIAKNPADKLQRYLSGVEWVVNCSGVVKSRINKMPIEDVLHVNSAFPGNLAKLGARLGLKCIHISCSMVFTGKKGNYTEQDFCDADDIYGMTKAAGETNTLMTIRAGVVGEERKQNRSLLEFLRSNAGKDVNGYTNIRWNGLSSVCLSACIEKIISGDNYSTGIFHLHSPDNMNEYELISLINDIYNLRLRVNKVEAKGSIDLTLTSINKLANELVSDPIEKQITDMRSFFET